MGLTDFLGDVFDTSFDFTDNSLLSGASSTLEALGGSGIFSGGGLPSAFPVNNSQPPMSVYPVAAQMPMIARAAGAGIARWSVQFPSLWQALQRYRASGINMTVPKLWRMFKQIGPTAMAGAIGVAALMDLMTYKATHKTRRMNPANTTALRRSLRRLKSFDRLCGRVSAQLSRASHGRSRKRSGPRCGSCRKNPCAC